jgi:predicted peptidase
MKNITAFLLIVSFLTATVVASDESPAPGKQVVQEMTLPASTSTWRYDEDSVKENIGQPKPLDTSKTETLRYWLFLPNDYESQAAASGVPLLLFLHGAGERGNQPEQIDWVKKLGVPKMLDNPEFRKNFPCITVSPQCRSDYTWSPAQLMLLLDDIEKRYKIDKTRIYVTGLSMGGFGTWMCLHESPKRFAAAAPLCGGTNLDWAATFTEIPVWVFHGTKDSVVPFVLSQNIVDAVKKAGGKKIIFTKYEGAGHDIWTQTYSNQLFYDWLLSQRNEKITRPNRSPCVCFDR